MNSHNKVRHCSHSGYAITVLIPVFNARDDIGKCIDSVLSQQHCNLHIFVSDNCSTDGTTELLNQKYLKDSRVTIFRQKQNVGPSANFLFLLSQLETEYFMFLGADDFISPGFISAAVEHLIKNPDVDILIPLVQYVNQGHLYFGRNEMCDSSSPMRRIINYISRVQDNGGFYHLGRSAGAYEQLEQCLKLPSHVGLDHCYMILRYYFNKPSQDKRCVLVRNLGRESDLFPGTEKGLKYCLLVLLNSCEYVKNMFVLMKHFLVAGRISVFSFLYALLVIVCFHFIKRNIGVFGSIYLKPILKFRR